MINERDPSEILKTKIENLDKQIALLAEVKQKCLNQLEELQKPAQAVPEQPIAANFTPEEKIAIFAEYFRGRTDVHARLWINNRSGKKGYSPACKNEWVREFCKKPAIKCGECPHQAFLPLDSEAFRQHLTGKQVIGIYPMLQNENCCFLAMDFDKEQWLDDACALMATCKEEGVPAALERSRSGAGCHVWIFFEEEIPAVLARKLGSYLITKTMAKRFQLDMKSYDRLFPNQDTIPRGGFGNLIALPFQKEAVLTSNTVFIDNKGMPYSDQWGFLKSVRKMTYQEVQMLVDQGIRSGQIIAVRQNPWEENEEPWMRLPSGKRRFKPTINNLLESIEAVLSNRIFIKIGNNPPINPKRVI